MDTLERLDRIDKANRLIAQDRIEVTWLNAAMYRTQKEIDRLTRQTQDPALSGDQVEVIRRKIKDLKAYRDQCFEQAQPHVVKIQAVEKEIGKLENIDDPEEADQTDLAEARNPRLKNHRERAILDACDRRGIDARNITEKDQNYIMAALHSQYTPASIRAGISKLKKAAATHMR